MVLENQLAIGNGIYTITEIARILRLPYHKVAHWVSEYWDGELGHAFESSYSWKVDSSKAVSFHTLVEFYVLIQFAEAGVKTRQVLNAHKELSEQFDTPFPFAQKTILENIRTDGKKIYLCFRENVISLDGTRQLNLDFINIFFKNLDFDHDNIASRLWPMGKEKNIVVDPKRQFGHPVVGDSNIHPETLFNLYQGGENIKFISILYEIPQKDVKDAIEYCIAVNQEAAA